jgi:hypothetical protein
MRRRGESGNGRIGCILWALGLAVVVLICWKAVPVKIASAELYDFMEEQAKFSGLSQEAMKKGILLRARELDLPVQEKQVSVERFGDRIRMRVTYTVPLEFPGYTYYWNFNHEVDRTVFYF